MESVKGLRQAARTRSMADQIKWNGHTFLCSSAVTADMDFRACGTAEELCMGIFNTPGPLGYKEAAVGESFIKPGVGILGKASDEDYYFEKSYKIIQPLKWDVQSGNNWIAEPKIAISLITWGFYLVMVYLRTSAGWRGRSAPWSTPSARTWGARFARRA